MPTACDDVSLYPENLLEADGYQISEHRWWAVYTKSRQEKALARQLHGYQIPFYLPLVRSTYVCRRRRFVVRVPLFTGYVFLYCSEEQRVRSFTTNRISRMLPVNDSGCLCRDLRQIFRLIASGAPLTAYQRLAPGNRVRIRYGPLAGLEGIVLVRRSVTRLFVAVDFLQQGASVDVEDCFLEPCA